MVEVRVPTIKNFWAFSRLYADIIYLDYTVPAMEVDLQEARQLFETNFFAVILMSQTFLPLLLKAKGTIVQIGSVSGVSTAGI